MKMIMRYSKHCKIMSQNCFFTYTNRTGKTYFKRNYLVSICWSANEYPTSLNDGYENRSVNRAWQQQSEWLKDSMNSTNIANSRG